jgi:hypothetical protein
MLKIILRLQRAVVPNAFTAKELQGQRRWEVKEQIGIDTAN